MKAIKSYLSTTKPPSAAANPAAVYQFDGTASWLTDRTGNGNTLTSSTGTFEFYPDALGQMLGAFCDSGQDHELLGPNNDNLRISKVTGGGGSGALTVEAIVRQDTANTVIAEMAASGETLATNVLYTLGYSSGGSYTSFFENGAGSDNTLTFARAVETGKMVYIALTISSDGLTHKLYINGILQDTQVGANPPEKAAASNTQRLYIGRSFDGSKDFKGLLFSLRISSETYPAAAIAETWDQIYGDIFPLIGDSQPQQLSAVEDAYRFPLLKGAHKANDPLQTMGGVAQGVPGPPLAAIQPGNRQGPDDVGAYEDVAGLKVQKYGQTQQGLFAQMPLLNEPQQTSTLEDTLVRILGSVPKFAFGTFDQWGAAHFSSTSGDLTVWDAYYYDARNEPWSDPTANGFSGFAKNGNKYTSGVLDVGPVQAPWASEATGAHRSPRDDFPDRALLVVYQGDKGGLCIFDLDGYTGTVASLTVWMRFELGNSSNFRFLGRVATSIQHAYMRNGVLVVATQNNGLENGATFVFDFKQDGSQNAGQFIRSDTHQRLVSGRNLTMRNNDGGGHWTTTLQGGATSLVVDSENVYRNLLWTEAHNRFWVVVVGEDTDPQTIYFENNIAQWSRQVQGDDTGTLNLNQYFYRNIHLDRDGWLWSAHDNKVWRNSGYWRDGNVYQYNPQTSTNRALRFQKGLVLPATVYWLTSAGDFIYAVTDNGLYAIHRGTLAFHLAYTTTTGFGQGRTPANSTGLRVAGGNNRAYKAQGFDNFLTSYLSVATTWAGENGQGGEGGGATLIRLKDDKQVQGLENPAIPEDGAFFHIAFWR